VIEGLDARSQGNRVGEKIASATVADFVVHHLSEVFCNVLALVKLSANFWRFLRRRSSVRDGCPSILFRFGCELRISIRAAHDLLLQLVHGFLVKAAYDRKLGFSFRFAP